MSEKMGYYKTNGIDSQMHENVMARKCLCRLDARKFTCAKIFIFTVVLFVEAI